MDDAHSCSEAMSSLKTYEDAMVNSGTLNDGPHPVDLGYKKTRTPPFSFQSSGTWENGLAKPLTLLSEISPFQHFLGRRCCNQS